MTGTLRHNGTQQTTWYVTEPDRTYSLTTSAPHLLRWMLGRWAGTHRVTAVMRRRAASGLSSLRCTLEPLSGGEPVVVRADLMRSQRPTWDALEAPAHVTALAATQTGHTALIAV